MPKKDKEREAKKDRLWTTAVVLGHIFAVAEVTCDPEWIRLATGRSGFPKKGGNGTQKTVIERCREEPKLTAFEKRAAIGVLLLGGLYQEGRGLNAKALEDTSDSRLDNVLARGLRELQQQLKEVYPAIATLEEAAHTPSA